MDAIVDFFCRYAYNLYMMRHLQFTWDDFSERPQFSTLITNGPAFWFDMSDITRIRTEFFNFDRLPARGRESSQRAGSMMHKAKEVF